MKYYFLITFIIIISSAAFAQVYLPTPIPFTAVDDGSAFYSAGVVTIQGSLIAYDSILPGTTPTSIPTISTGLFTSVPLDRGLMIGVQGTDTYFDMGSVSHTLTDFCLNSSQLVEFGNYNAISVISPIASSASSNPAVMVAALVICPSGLVCSSGACILPEVPNFPTATFTPASGPPTSLTSGKIFSGFINNDTTKDIVVGTDFDEWYSNTGSSHPGIGTVKMIDGITAAITSVDIVSGFCNPTGSLNCATRQLSVADIDTASVPPSLEEIITTSPSFITNPNQLIFGQLIHSYTFTTNFSNTLGFPQLITTGTPPAATGSSQSPPIVNSLMGGTGNNSKQIVSMTGYVTSYPSAGGATYATKLDILKQNGNSVGGSPYSSVSNVIATGGSLIGYPHVNIPTAIIPNPQSSKYSIVTGLTTNFGSASEVRVINPSNGTLLLGWSQLINSSYHILSVAVGNVVGTPAPEIIVWAAPNNSPSPPFTGLIYAYDFQGNTISGFPVVVNIPTFTAAGITGPATMGSCTDITLADIGGTPEKEIIIGGNCGVVRGPSASAIPFTPGIPFGDYSLLGDVTGDGVPELLYVGRPRLGLYAIDLTTGSPVLGYPLGYYSGLNWVQHFKLDDIDSDGLVEIIATSTDQYNQYVHVYRTPGLASAIRVGSRYYDNQNTNYFP